MDKQILIALSKSLLITLAVAGTIAFFLSSIGLLFLPTFLFCILLQFLGFYFYGEYIKRKNNRVRITAELKLAEEMSKQQATVVCPCDRGVETTIPIKIAGENKYTCPGCTKEIKVFVSTKTALTTIPTDSITT